MQLYRCNSCDIVFPGDNWSYNCPRCGSCGVQNDSPARYYRCYSCDIVFAGDEWHRNCPKCGNSCSENDAPARFYE